MLKFIFKKCQKWGISFQIRQLFSNLLTNALKYSQANKIPTIKISHQIINNDQHHLDPKVFGDEYHQISIKDNGIGFDQQFLDKIFGMFQRLHPKDKYSGTGMGLAICKKIMQIHGGLIKAASNSGQSTTFYILFPIKPK